MPRLTTEFKTTQEPFIKYAQKAGWEYISEDKALDLRKKESNNLFYNVLKEALIKLNSDFINEDNVDNLIQQIDAIQASIEGNKESLDWLRGNKTFYHKEEKRNRNVQLIDFQNPENNIFQITEEWFYRNLVKPNKADIMFLINGFPIAIVENKKPLVKYSMEKAIIQLKRYEKETPEMLSYPQIFNITDVLYYFYGATWNFSRKGIFNWKKEIGEQREKRIKMEEAVLSFFEKKHFLKIIKDWVLFYYKENELNKTILKQHQTRAVQKVIERCSTTEKKRGLIWHTQGSGKTFSMITSARLILDTNKQATVMLIVDRNELEGQLENWIENIMKELSNNSVPVKKACSKRDLKNILKEDFRGLIISMIHKFHNIEPDLCNRKDFYIFIDEAHRSIEGDLGNYLMGALPNATIIGWTGTPIDKTSKGKGTFKIFGKEDKKAYLDKYSIAESIEDGTTVKIRHSLAPNHLNVSEEILEKEFFQMANTEGISDIETLNKVLERAVRLKNFLKSQDRIDKISHFVADHFTKNVEPLGYKAFLVAVDREACALYKEALDRYLPQDFSKVVYTEAFNDQGLLKKYHLNKDEETQVRKNFVNAKLTPKILIVTDKLLTGYDASVLYCMYLDKPMRDHVLLQAIARVNRPYEDAGGREKTCGLVVDFIGVFRNLRKALSFDSQDVESAVENLDDLMQEFQNLVKEGKTHYLSGIKGQSDKALEKIVYETLWDKEERERFIDLFEKLQNAYEILSPDSQLRPYIEDYRQMAELYQILQNLYKNKPSFISEVCKKTEKLIQNATTVQKFSGIVKNYDLDEKALKELKKSSDKSEKNKKIIDLVRSLEKEAEEKSSTEPYLISIAERARSIMESFIEQQKASKSALEEILELLEDKKSIQKMKEQSSLSHKEFVIYFALQKHNIKQAYELSTKINKIFDKFKNFQNNAEEQRLLKMDIYQILSDVVSDEELLNFCKAIMDLVGKVKT